MMEPLKKSFNDCTLIYLEKNFGLEQVHTLPAMEKWANIAQQMPISDFENEELRLCQDLLNDNILHWNEQELSLHFIGPIFSLIRFTDRVRKFNLFAERYIAATVETLKGDLVELCGKPDGLLATGYREPESPFFCFTEYKRHREPDGEPEGQCLSAMLAGQSLNQHQPHEALYGCYVMGRDWYFIVLQGQQYCISQDFSAVTTDIFEVFKMLKALKEIIKEHRQ